MRNSKLSPKHDWYNASRNVTRYFYRKLPSRTSRVRVHIKVSILNTTESETVIQVPQIIIEKITTELLPKHFQ